MTEDSTFSVCQFFEDGNYEYTRRWVSAEEAVKAFKHYTSSVGARLGTTTRVIITDALDCTNMEWEFGKASRIQPRRNFVDIQQQVAELMARGRLFVGFGLPLIAAAGFIVWSIRVYLAQQED